MDMSLCIGLADCMKPKDFWLEEAYCVGVGTNTCSTTSASGTASATSSISASSSSLTGTITSGSSSGSTATFSVTQNATYSTRYPVTTNNLTTTAVDTAFPPSRTQSGQPSYCTTWHLVNQGDTCQSIVNQYGIGITLDEL
jgi:hypothetical protein